MSHFPDFWLQRRWQSGLLWPVSLLFGLLAAARRAGYRLGWLTSIRLPIPVVVVGNISVGGTGKTPLTLALAAALREAGWRPLIVSRGYGGSAQTPRVVGPDSAPAEVGDEPLLMARRGLCPVWIGRDRAEAARLGLAAQPECNVVLCDDGLQHYRLQRGAEIAVLDGARGLGNGWLLPAGMLREPASRLRSVTAVVVNGAQGDVRMNLHLRTFGMQLAGGTFVNLRQPQRTAQAADFAAKTVHAVAGIGNPARYFTHLRQLGLSVVEHSFPDHHPYRAADFAFAGPDDVLLLTEKDAVKCAAFADERFWLLRVEAQLDPALIPLLLRTLHGSQTA